MIKNLMICYFIISKATWGIRFGDVSVNKKMKDFNKVYFDILPNQNQQENFV